MNGLTPASPNFAGLECFARMVIQPGGISNTIPMFWVPQTYQDLLITTMGRATNVGTQRAYVQVLLHFNDPVYYPTLSPQPDCESQQLRESGNNANQAAHSAVPFGDFDVIIGGMPGSDGTASQAGYCEAVIPQYRRPISKRAMLSRSFEVLFENDGPTNTGTYMIVGGGTWINTEPLFHVSVYTDGGNFAVGSVISLYGRG